MERDFMTWMCGVRVPGLDQVICVGKTDHKKGKHVWDYNCRELMRGYKSVTLRRRAVEKTVRTLTKKYPNILNEIKHREAEQNDDDTKGNFAWGNTRKMW